jgi:hypothetical protein
MLPRFGYLLAPTPDVSFIANGGSIAHLGSGDQMPNVPAGKKAELYCGAPCSVDGAKTEFVSDVNRGNATPRPATRTLTPSVGDLDNKVIA